MAKVSAIVLAAGLSRRMGKQNKMALEFKGKPLGHHVIEQIDQSNAFETVIITSEVSEALLSDYATVLNEQYRSGMTSSIQKGVAASSPESDGYMICLADQPLITTEAYNQIIAAFEESFEKDPKAIVLPTYQDKRGNPVILSSAYKKMIQDHQEPEGCKGIVQAHRAHLSFVPMMSDAVLMDVDLPEDYERLVDMGLKS